MPVKGTASKHQESIIDATKYGQQKQEAYKSQTLFFSNTNTSQCQQSQKQTQYCQQPTN